MSLLKEEYMAKDNVRDFLLRQRILLMCDCGKLFYKNSKFSDEGIIYAIVENEFSKKYSNKKIYRGQVKQLLAEATLNDSCPDCYKKFK